MRPGLVGSPSLVSVCSKQSRLASSGTYAIVGSIRKRQDFDAETEGSRRFGEASRRCQCPPIGIVVTVSGRGHFAMRVVVL